MTEKSSDRVSDRQLHRRALLATGVAGAGLLLAPQRPVAQTAEKAAPRNGPILGLGGHPGIPQDAGAAAEGEHSTGTPLNKPVCAGATVLIQKHRMTRESSNP